jgi:hypothetical protein
MHQGLHRSTDQRSDREHLREWQAAYGRCQGPLVLLWQLTICTTSRSSEGRLRKRQYECVYVGLATSFRHQHLAGS